LNRLKHVLCQAVSDLDTAAQDQQIIGDGNKSRTVGRQDNTRAHVLDHADSVNQNVFTDLI
jgi:hypothetical protein